MHPRRRAPSAEILSAVTLSTLLATGCGKDGSIDLTGTGGHAATSGATASVTASASGTGGAGGGCALGTTNCGGSCVDERSDPLHCGGCTTTCGHYQYCQGAACTCEPGMTQCGGSCFDLESNPEHCGGCNHACAHGERCEGHTCLSGACSASLTGCHEANSELSCVNLANGYPYCGSCGTVCDPTELCVGVHCLHYVPAAGCTACPCTAECTALLGSPSTCCPGIYGGVDPICVAGTACP